MRSVLAGIVAMLVITFFVGVLMTCGSTSSSEDFVSQNGSVRLD